MDWKYPIDDIVSANDADVPGLLQCIAERLERIAEMQAARLDTQDKNTLRMDATLKGFLEGVEKIGMPDFTPGLKEAITRAEATVARHREGPDESRQQPIGGMTGSEMCTAANEAGFQCLFLLNHTGDHIYDSEALEKASYLPTPRRPKKP